MLNRRSGSARSAALPVLLLYDAQMQELYHDRLDRFPFPEAVILAASQEYFDDPQPCEIHRRAVQVRLSAELEQALPVGQLLTADEAPPLLLLYCQGYHFAFVKLALPASAKE